MQVHKGELQMPKHQPYYHVFVLASFQERYKKVFHNKCPYPHLEYQDSTSQNLLALLIRFWSEYSPTLYLYA